MAEMANLTKVMMLTTSYRIVGTMRLGPDGTIWDFKHKPDNVFVTVYDAQCFRIGDGKRMYDASVMRVNKVAVEAIFEQQDVAFVRKETT